MLGMYGWLQQRRREVRKEVKHQIIAGLDRSELVLLTFTPEQQTKLKWEHSQEFEFDGEMYDVVEMEVIDGITQYWCWPDNEESALNRQLNELLLAALDQDPQHRDGQRQLSHFLQLLYVNSNGQLAFICAIGSDEGFFGSSDQYLNWSSKPPSPPPQLG
jgi:hypothetical protein